SDRSFNEENIRTQTPLKAQGLSRLFVLFSYRILVGLVVEYSELSAPYKMSSEITIPSDILCDIFHLLCDGPIALHDLRNESHFHEFPWAVGQVCRHWRGTFLSYTHLWTSFALKPGDFGPAYCAEMNRRTTIYLKRSGQQPLTIDASTWCDSWSEIFPNAVWRMLLSCLKRWEKADLVLRRGAARNELLRRRGHMSSLKSLRMYISNSTALKHNNAFQVAPHLTELDLSHRGFAATWQFPWAQLTKLRIKTCCDEFKDYGHKLWGVLSQLDNIEELHIIATFSRVLPLSPRPIIRLPGLRVLGISLASATIISWLTAPLLTHLHIHGGCYFTDLYFLHCQPYKRELTSLIQRSSCHIRQLTLESCGRGEMRIIMEALASVEELSINYPLSESLAIIQDVTGLDGCIYLPKLRVLQVACSVHQDLVTIFSSLLEARGEGMSLASQDMVPLEKFVLRLIEIKTFARMFSDKELKVMRGWPSFAQVYIKGAAGLERLAPSS
ncbi:hypothetical protein F5887DRAFT_235734, partial [Amanita rubescens]